MDELAQARSRLERLTLRVGGLEKDNHALRGKVQVCGALLPGA
jgi:hypothetical protein